MPDDLSQVFDPEPAELPVKKPRRRKLPVEAEAPSSDTSPPDTPRRGRRKATEPTPDGADAPVPDESEKPRRRRSRSTALAPGSEQQPSDAAAAVAEPAIDVFVTEPEPASAHADLPDELHDTGKNRTAPLADDSAFDEAAVLDSANDAVLANYADPPAVEIEFSDPVEDAATAAAAAPDERLLAERLDEGFRAAEVEPMEPAAMEDDFSLPEDFPLLDDAEFSDALDAAEPAETAPPDPAFSLAEEAPLLDDTEFSGTFDDGEPAAAPRFHESANEEPVPSTSDAEAAPFDAAFSLAEEDPVPDDAEFSDTLDDVEPAAAPRFHESANEEPVPSTSDAETTPFDAAFSLAEEDPVPDDAEFSDTLDDVEPAAAPRFHDSANEEPVPSTSDAEAAPFDAAFSLAEEDPVPDDAEFSDTLDDVEPAAAPRFHESANEEPVPSTSDAETTPFDAAFSLAEEDPVPDDAEFSDTLDDVEPAAAPRFHDSANEEPVPSTSDAEAAPFDAAFSLAEEDPVLDDAEFSQVLDDAEPAAAPGIYEVAPTDYAQAVATAPTPAPLSVAEEAPRLDAAEFADPLGAAGTVDAAGLNRDVPTAEEPPADPVEAPRLARAEPVEATSAPSDGSVIEDVSLYRETPPLQAAAQAEERPFREEFAAQDFPPPISGMATPEQAPIEPDEPLVLHQALPSDPMPGIPNRNSAAEVPQDIPLQSPPLILDENEPDGAEQEELSMPRPLVAEPPGDAHREPTIASTTTAEATAEMSSLSPGPLTEPPDNGPPLMPLDEAAATDGETAQGEKGATSSKAWGPVRGAIETAMANIGPLLPISRAEQLRRQVVGAVRGQFAKIAGLADSLVFAKLPWLKRIGALVPRRRSTLIGGGLLMAAVAGGAGVRLLLSNVPAPPPAPVLGPPSLPSHVARRLGQELEMSVVSVPKGPTELFATGEDQLDSALALSRREAAGDGIVISLDALAGASRRVLAWYGLGSSITVKPSSGPTLTFQGDVPDALYPLAHAALDNIGQLLGRDPVLKTVQIRDQIAKSDTALLRAIFIGSPKSIVYTTDGAREIGESLYGDFTIKAIDPDSVVLAPAQPGSKITVTVPLREPSAATVEGPPLAALPDRSAVVLMQQPRSAKE